MAGIKLQLNLMNIYVIPNQMELARQEKCEFLPFLSPKEVDDYNALISLHCIYRQLLDICLSTLKSHCYLPFQKNLVL